MLDALQSMALNGVSFLSISRSVICAFGNTLKNVEDPITLECPSYPNIPFDPCILKHSLAFLCVP